MPLNDQNEVIESSHLSLEEWLNLVFNPPDRKIFIRNRFPTANHSEEYLATVDKRPVEEIYSLIDIFLVHSTEYSFYDEMNTEVLKHYLKEDPEKANIMIRRPYYMRLVNWSNGNTKSPPWEGVTWILELLPHFPQRAIDIIFNYVLAHSYMMPDVLMSGMWDAAAIIRAKFIGVPGTQPEKVKFLLSLSDREFESLVERLYNKIGYNTSLTPPKKDGGRDIIALKDMIGQKEKVAIECKRYEKPVAVEYARRLQGTVSMERFSKGVLVTSSRFTRGCKYEAQRDNRLELIDGNILVTLLNQYLGSEWTVHVDRLISESQRANIPI